MRAVTDSVQARRLTAEQHAEVQKKLDDVAEGMNALRIALEGIQALLTPCYGELDGEACILPDRHRGRHLSDAGTEWVDND